MNETEKRIEEVIKKVNCGKTEDSKTIINKASSVYALLQKYPKSKNIKQLFNVKKVKNSAHKKLNEHDMLQANQANLRCSTSYANNIKQVININSTIHERYQKLQKISLHHILSKGNYCDKLTHKNLCSS